LRKKLSIKNAAQSLIRKVNRVGQVASDDFEQFNTDKMYEVYEPQPVFQNFQRDLSQPVFQQPTQLVCPKMQQPPKALPAELLSLLTPNNLD
jgi:hypothetical protein